MKAFVGLVVGGDFHDATPTARSREESVRFALKFSPCYSANGCL